MHRLTYGLVAGFVFCAISMAHAQEYTITDLGILGGTSSYANAVNLQGSVVGYSATSAGANHAFLYSNATMTDLGTLGGIYTNYTTATGINSSKMITGYSYTSGQTAVHAFLDSNGTMTDLGTLGGTDSYAYGINASGSIVGTANNSGDHGSDAFVYSNGYMTDLGTLGGPYVSSFAAAINDLGQVVGNSGVANSLPITHAFLYSGGSMTDLGSLGGPYVSSFAAAINDLGQVVGGSYLAGDSAGTGPRHAFLDSGGTMTDLGTLGGQYVNSEASGINDFGQIVGEGFDNNGDNQALLYSGGTMANLNSLLPANSGWNLLNATAINDDGQIVGDGADHGQVHAFLLSPVVLPGTWATSGSGDWNVAGNWSETVVPNGANLTVDFLGSITSASTVYSNTPVTAGTIKFISTSKYVIAGAGSLTLQVSTGNALLEVDQGNQEINLPLTIASNTIFDVSSGSTLVIADPVSINSGLSITQTGGGNVTYESTITVGSGATITFGDSTFANSLTLESSANASIAGNGNNIQLESLALASGSKLDIGQNEITVDYVGSSAAGEIQALLKSGYNKGAWNGASGIISTAASFAQGTSVGYIDTGSSVIVKYTWLGDLNLDGTVTSADLTIMDANMGKSNATWSMGDLNYDGVVNADDFSLFTYGDAMAARRDINELPEPHCIILLGLAVAFVNRRESSPKKSGYST
jgi:probable HAF family extracellular repeat protein